MRLVHGDLNRVTMVNASNIEVVLFDLGGVIIDIDFDRAVKYWATASGKSFEAIKSRFTIDADYQQHERGEIPSVEFFHRLRRTLGVDLSIEEMAAGWNALIIGEIEGIALLLDTIPEEKPIYAFSNINPEHLDTCWSRFEGILSRFNKLFASSEIGRRKPEPEAFQLVVDELAVHSQNILFFDDLIDNVEAARDCGLQAIHVRDKSDIENGLLPVIDKK